MKNNAKFSKIKLPDTQVASHKRILKNALLQEYDNYQKKPALWKGGELIMKHKTFSIAAVGFIAVALFFGITMVSINALPFTATAEAQEIVDRAFDHIIKLSPQEKENLKAKLKADLESSLIEAKNAKDLQIVPEEEIQRIEKPVEAGEKEQIGFVFKNKDIKYKPGDTNEMKPGTRVIPDGGKIMAPHGVKVLRYTNADGAKVILGINEKDEPVMKMIHLNIKFDEGEIKSQKIFHQKLD